MAGVPLWVADGYHRVCASYHLNEKVLVPCRMTARTPKGLPDFGEQPPPLVAVVMEVELPGDRARLFH